jgi:hypothetical protein
MKEERERGRWGIFCRGETAEVGVSQEARRKGVVGAVKSPETQLVMTDEEQQ